MKTLKTLDDIQALLAKYPKLYVRWSRGPRLDLRRGYSIDYATGQAHPGLSCVEINRDQDRTGLVARLMSYSYIAKGDPKSYCWIATGEYVGRDSDNAPLIASVKPLARLSDELKVELQREDRARINAKFEALGWSDLKFNLD